MGKMNSVENKKLIEEIQQKKAEMLLSFISADFAKKVYVLNRWGIDVGKKTRGNYIFSSNSVNTHLINPFTKKELILPLINAYDWLEDGASIIVKVDIKEICEDNPSLEKILFCRLADSELKRENELRMKARKKIAERKAEENREIEKTEKEKNNFLTILHSYGFEGPVHYTDIDNLYKILECGELLCRKEASKKGFVDAADQDAIDRTTEKVLNYVRFYYKGKTPTLYRNEGIKAIKKGQTMHMPRPVALVFDEEILFHRNVLYLNGSAANIDSSKLVIKDVQTTVTGSVNTALNYEWEKIMSRNAYGSDDHKAVYTSRRNAEFLYPKRISLKYLKRVIFRSEAELKIAENILGKNDLFSVGGEEYFCYADINKYGLKVNFINTMDVIEENKTLTLKLCFEYYDNNINNIYAIIRYESMEKERLDFNEPTDRFNIESFVCGHYNYVLTIKKDNRNIESVDIYYNEILAACWEKK